MPRPDFVDLVEMLHHLNQSENGSDDADGGRESSGRLKYLRNLLFVLGLIVEFQFHDLAQFLGLGAVDRQHERFLQERIVDLGELGVEGDDALAACFLGVLHQSLNRSPADSVWD